MESKRVVLRVKPGEYVSRRKPAQVKPFSKLFTEIERWLGFGFFVVVLGYLFLVPVLYPIAGEMDLGLIKALPFYEMVFLGALIYIEIVTKNEQFVRRIRARQLAGLPLMVCAGMTFVYIKTFEIDIFSTETLLAAALPAFQAVVLFAKFKLSGLGVTSDTLRMPIVLSVFAWIAAILATYGTTMDANGLRLFGAALLMGIGLSAIVFSANVMRRWNLEKRVFRHFLVPYYDKWKRHGIVNLMVFWSAAAILLLFFLSSFAIVYIGENSGLVYGTIVQLVALYAIMFPAALFSFPGPK